MKLKITVHGVAYEVDVEVLDPGEGFPAQAPVTKIKPKNQTPAPGAAQLPPKPAHSAPAVGGAVASPIAGLVLEIKCKPGDNVTKGQALLVIEAMKMKTSIAAPTAGKIKSIPVAVGDSVQENQSLVEFE